MAQGIELGQRKEREQDYGSALVFFDLVIELARSAPFAHFERAKTLALMGRNKDVLPELRKAMEEAIRSRRPKLINAVIDEGGGTESGRITSLNPTAKKK